MKRMSNQLTIMFLSFMPLCAQMSSPEKFVALQSHFKDKEQIDPGTIGIWAIVVVVTIIVAIIQRQIHMHHIRKQHEEMLRHHKEMISNQKEIIHHIKRK